MLMTSDTAAPMTEPEIRAEIRRLAPFHHAVELPYGLLAYDPERSRREVERTRLTDLGKYVRRILTEVFGESLAGRRVLDVACNCGGFSVEAARRGASVLGIDIVDHYLEQANFIKRALGLTELEYRKLAIEEVDSGEVGMFDAVFFFDILWHLENPVLATRRLAAVTRRLMIVETRLTSVDTGDAPAWIMNFLPPTSADATDVSTSLWRTGAVCQFSPNARAVIELLHYLGFADVRQVELEPQDRDKRFINGESMGLFVALR
jgi:tRNA (mo5U34)-methyltransferase